MIAGSVSDSPLLAPNTRPLIGVLHLPPLAGPGSPGPNAISKRALEDAQAYRDAGFDAVIVENFGDTPFPKQDSNPHVPAMMALVAQRVREETGLEVGVNVLRNDALSAMGVAVAAGCAFVRVNVLTGAVVADQGIIEGCAHALAEYRRSLGGPADRVFVAADVQVKHASPIAPRPIEQEAQDAVMRAGADVLLVTGAATGAPAELDTVRRIREVVGVPVWVASGVTKDTVAGTLEVAQGVIVGSAVKQDNDPTKPVDPHRAAAFAKAAAKTFRQDR